MKFHQKLKCSSWKQEKNPLSKMGYLSQQLRTVCYILLLPVLDGPFRASLQGNTVNELEFCIESGSFNLCNFILDVDQCGFNLFCLLILFNISEFCGLSICASGDPNVQTSQVTEAIFMNSGDNPFKLIRNSIKYI